MSLTRGAQRTDPACMGTEVELKLELAASAADELERAGLFGPSKGHALLHATYFDTAGWHLRTHGMSLRIRLEGKRLIQAVKTLQGSATGLFDRGEWEFPVPGWKPVVDERTPLPRTLGECRDALVAQFDLIVHRDNFLMESGDAAIKVALDRGTARAMERSAAFCEVELELTSGDPAALFALARRVDAVAPVRIGVLTKADRGFRLLDKLRPAEMAGQVGLLPSLTPVAACTQVLASCLRHYRLNEAILLQRPEREAVHQARIALRRLRSARSIFADLLRDAAPENAGKRLDFAVRDLAREYGKVRDLDVLISRAADDEVRARLVEQRARAAQELAVTVGGPATRHLLMDLAEWIAIGPWRDAGAGAGSGVGTMPLPEFAARALDRCLRRVRRHGRHLAELDDAARHEFRKEAKKLRYAVEFFAGIYATGPAARHRRKFLAALEDLQDYLGELNDLVFEQQLLGLAAPDRSAEKTGLLHKADKARHALLDCKLFWG